jgi:general secretion pathway protein L
MSELNIFIDPAWPQDHTDAVWYLCDRAGRILQHGRGEPRHWPGVRGPAEARDAAGAKDRAGQTVNLILTGGQVACHRVRLPRGASGRRAEILAAALEDRLLADPAECVFLPAPPDDDGLTPVAVVSRERLRGILALLGELGLVPRAAWADGHLLPERDGRRVARFEAGMLVVPVGKSGFASFDLPAEGAPDGPFAALVPAGLPVLVGLEGDAGLLPAGIALQPDPEGTDRFPLAPPPPGGFLVGEFAPPGARLAGLRALRPALRLGTGLAALLLVLVLSEWAWLAFRVHQVREASVQVFKEVFPQAVLVDPALQMQRQLDGRRRQVGHAGASGRQQRRDLAAL